MYQPLRSLHQDAAINEFDRTFPAHRVQAHGYAFPRGSDNGGNLTVWQGDVNEHSLSLGHAVAIREVCEQPIQTGGNRIKCEVGQTTLRILKSLTDQSESVIMKLPVPHHPPLKFPRRNLD